MLKITIFNRYAPTLVESYCCFNVDVSDLNEVDYCIQETIGAFMDTHEKYLKAVAPDRSFDELYDAIEYIAEEVDE